MKRFYKIKKVIALIICLNIFILGIIFSEPGCSAISERQTKVAYPSLTYTISKTTTTNVIKTSTPIVNLQSPTITLDNNDDLDVTLSVTIGPVWVATTTPKENDYLYNNAIVTVRIFPIDDLMGARISYINLDDLMNNNNIKSDVEILVGGKIDFIGIKPANGATYFLLDENKGDYYSCLDHFPVEGLDRTAYETQGLNFEKGKSYCFFTNEGRIALVKFNNDSKKYNNDGSFDFSMIITVFSKKIY